MPAELQTQCKPTYVKCRFIDAIISHVDSIISCALTVDCHEEVCILIFGISHMPPSALVFG